MLRYLLRTAPVVLRARADGTRISRLRRRVRLSEIDLNLHMNQAVYAQVCELGRTDWVFRSGAWDRWRSAGANPVVAEQRLVYRRELSPLARFTVDTRAVAIEGRLLRFESHLIRGDVVHTLGEAKLIFVGEGGVLSPERVEALCGDLLVEPLPVEGWKVVGRDAA